MYAVQGVLSFWLYIIAAARGPETGSRLLL